MKTKKMAKLAIFTAIALLMFIIEGMLPPLIPIAGVKIGLANVVTFVALIILGVREAYAILLLRCLLASLFGNISALMYSIPSGLISLTAECLLYKFAFPKMSLMSISFVAALLFNFTQVFMASIIAQTSLVILLPLSLLGSLIAGSFIGLATFYVIKSLPKSVYMIKGAAD